jgi:general secretion pathway protein M
VTSAHPIATYLVRYRNVSATLYVAFVVAAFLIVILSIVDVSERYRARNASAAMLVELEQHASLQSANMGNSSPVGSPFLQGQTTTVAAAALVQRVTEAITHAKGNIISSETQPTDDGDRVKIIVTSELEERALPQLLYEIEAGAPFIFIDRLVAQAPTSAAGRLHVMLAISGLWSGKK